MSRNRQQIEKRLSRKKSYEIRITRIVGNRLEVATIECESMKEAHEIIKELKKTLDATFIKIYDKEGRIVYYEFVIIDDCYA